MKVNNPIILQLLEKYKEISFLGNINATLNWDLNVNLPPSAAGERAMQSAYLTEKITDKWLASDFRNLLEKANHEKSLTIEEKAIIRNLNVGGKYYYKIPKAIIVKKEAITSEAFMIWRQAREENNVKLFLPHLEKIVALDQEIASYLGYQTNPYDALLDLYEPELTVSDCERLFGGVKKELVPLIKKITKSKQYTNSVAFIDGTIQYPISDQEKLLRYMVSKMGFDMSSGRVDVSAHPFTTQLGTNDVRLTTFYNPTDFRESFTSSTHEAGHGLYEQGVKNEYAHTPLAGGVSLGIHEALSRFWENMVGKNPAFLQQIFPMFQAFYATQLNGVTRKEFVRSFTVVKPSQIRIHADEVTYTLHIILRFEMENEIINGKIAVKDVADAWCEKSKKLFGFRPQTDSQGMLQDVHWAYGNFGYFPAYALGNLYGAQFLHTMKKTVNVDDELLKGNLLPIKQWLDKNIHQYGSLYFPKELVKKVTGEELNYTYFIAYLMQKYEDLSLLK